MKWSIRFVVAAIALLVSSAPARAQFGVPVQQPAVDPAGTFIIYPTIGVIHEGDDDDQAGFTDAALMLRGRYSLLDQLSVSAQIGGAFGDADAFVFGFGGKFQLLEQTTSTPVMVSMFGAFDVGIGDVDTQSLAFGPLVGHELMLGSLNVTPYGGLSMGFTHASVDNERGEDPSDTNFLFAFIFGTDVAFTRELSGITEFTLGVTDGIPILNWHLGIAYALFSAPKYVAPPATTY